jgi:hypothetical protein
MRSLEREFLRLENLKKVENTVILSHNDIVLAIGKINITKAESKVTERENHTFVTLVHCDTVDNINGKSANDKRNIMHENDNMVTKLPKNNYSNNLQVLYKKLSFPWHCNLLHSVAEGELLSWQEGDSFHKNIQEEEG